MTHRDVRGSGRTTRQMQAAPEGAFFIVPTHAAISYTGMLARHLKREDLQLHPKEWLERDRWRGTTRVIVVDHACRLDPRTRELVGRHNAVLL